MNSNCSNLLDIRNLQEQVKKAFCYQKLFCPLSSCQEFLIHYFCPFTVWINCSSDLKTFANSQPSASNFKSFSRSLEQFFLTVGQNNFGNKIPFFFSSQNAIFALKHKLESNTQRTQLSRITIRYFQYDDWRSYKQTKETPWLLSHKPGRPS